MTLPSAAVMVSSGPTGAAPCETQGSTSTPSSRTPTAPPVTTSSSTNSGTLPSLARALARPPSTGTPGARRPSSPRTASVGKRGVGEQDHRRRAVQVGQPGHRHAAEGLDGLGLERLGDAAVERRRPDGHAGAVLDLAPAADHAAGAAADERGRGEDLGDRLERRLRGREVAPRAEHGDGIGVPAVEPVPGDGRRRERGLTWVGARGEAAADADGHAG